MFSVLIWQDSCSYCLPFPAHVLSGWLCRLFVHYFAMPRALFISVPCILPSSSILQTFFCNWETSQFLSRLFSFFGIPRSLIISNHFSTCPAWPAVECETTEWFWGNYSGCCRAAGLFNCSSLSQCPHSHRCLSFILKSHRVFGFALNYCFGQKGGSTSHCEFCPIPQCLHQNRPFRWTLTVFCIYCQKYGTHWEVNPLWNCSKAMNSGSLNQI